MKLAAIAETLGGEVVQGDPEMEIEGVAGLEDAGASQLSFYENPKYRSNALASGAGALLVREELDGFDRAQIRVEHPYLQFLQVVRSFYPEREHPAGIHNTAIVSEHAELGDGVRVGPHVVIEAGARIGDRCVLEAGAYVGRNVKMGTDCRLFPRALVYDGCILGDRVVLHPGVVVGSDGFGYVRTPDAHVKIPHVGIVRIEDDVEIGANSTIDRGTFGETLIGQGTKLDNLVQVGHNVRIGPRGLLCGQVGVSGSCDIGADCLLAGQVGVADHVTIGDGSVVAAKAGVNRRVKAGTIVSGYPSMDHNVWIKASVAFTRLPELVKTVRRIEKTLRRDEEAD